MSVQIDNSHFQTGDYVTSVRHLDETYEIVDWPASPENDNVYLKMRNGTDPDRRISYFKSYILLEENWRKLGTIQQREVSKAAILIKLLEEGNPEDIHELLFRLEI